MYIRKKILKTFFSFNNPFSHVLSNRSQILYSYLILKILFLKPHRDYTKNWDLLKFLSFVSKNCDFKNSILDAGSGARSIVLINLKKLGFKNLSAVDILPKYNKSFHKHNITFYNKSVEEFAKVDSNKFDVIISQSVIEHSGNHKKHLNALNKLLSKNGYLLLSTDYFPTKIDCKGIFPYGKDSPEMIVFYREELLKLLNSVKQLKLLFNQWSEVRIKSSVVRWERVNRSYTFIVLFFRKK